MPPCSSWKGLIPFRENTTRRCWRKYNRVSFWLSNKIYHTGIFRSQKVVSPPPPTYLSWSNAKWLRIPKVSFNKFVGNAVSVYVQAGHVLLSTFVILFLDVYKINNPFLTILGEHKLGEAFRLFVCFKGSVSSSMPCTCRLLVWLCCRHFHGFMAHEQGDKQRPIKRWHVQGMPDETEPLGMFNVLST